MLVTQKEHTENHVRRLTISFNNMCRCVRVVHMCECVSLTDIARNECQCKHMTVETVCISNEKKTYKIVRYHIVISFTLVLYIMNLKFKIKQ